MTKVDELLEKHSLTRDNATAYIDAIIRMNASETANEVNVSRDTIHRYKRAFQEMSEEERAFLIAGLFDERWRELVQVQEA